MNNKLKSGKFTAIATENFIHAVKIVRSEGRFYKGEPINNEGDVCRAIGIHQPGLAGMKSGERAVTLEQAATMCHLFDFNLDWMIFRKGAMRGKDAATVRMDMLEQKIRDMEALMLTVKDRK